MNNRLLLTALLVVLTIAVFSTTETAYGRHTGHELGPNQNEPLRNTFIQPGVNRMSPQVRRPAIANSALVDCLAPNNTLCFQDPVEVMEVGNSVYGLEVGLLNGGANLDIVAAAMGAEK